jgi:hypothetical protein
VRKYLLSVLVGLAAVAASGCGGGNSTASNGAPPTACPDDLLAAPSLIYPANGATGVPDGTFTMMLDSNGFAPANITDAELTSAAGDVALSFVPTPSPQPTAPTPMPVPELQAGVAALAPATKYTLILSASTAGPCSYKYINAVIGSFTTK